MEESVKKAIEDITYITKKFPEKSFQVISKNKDLAVPYLNSAIEKAISEEDDLDVDYQLHFYALYLLAQFQERNSFSKIMELVSLPSETLDNLIGDTITSDLQDILYNTYDGNLELLKTAIKNPDINEYARCAMLDVMGQLYLDGKLEKSILQDFIRQLVYEKDEICLSKMEEDDGSLGYIYIGLIYTICNCNFVEMLPEIRYLFEEDRIDTFAIGRYEECVDIMFRYKERICRSPLNAADMLRSWSMFEQSEDAPKFSEKDIEKLLRKAEVEYSKTEKKIKVGRNDPCPCGSGKKYKKCCLNKPKTPVDLIESAEEKNKWLKHYPASAKERQEGRIYLEDYFDQESIEIDKLLYLALAHRAIPLWHKEADEVVENRKRVYLSEAFSKFTEKIERENIKTFQEYDEKYSIHYQCREWIPVLQKLLKQSKEKELYKNVSACWKKMQG